MDEEVNSHKENSPATAWQVVLGVKMCEVFPTIYG